MSASADLIACITTKAPNLEGIGRAIRLEVEGQSWTIQCRSPVVVEQRGGFSDCTITLTEETLQELLDRKILPQQAYNTGRIGIRGDPGLALVASALLLTQTTRHK